MLRQRYALPVLLTLAVAILIALANAPPIEMVGRAFDAVMGLFGDPNMPPEPNGPPPAWRRKKLEAMTQPARSAASPVEQAVAGALGVAALDVTGNQ